MGTGATDPLTDNEESVVSEDILGDDDGLRMDGQQVTYPASKERPTPHIILQGDSPSQNTRSKAQALLAADEMSGSCPSPRQSVSRTFPLQFLAEFAAVVHGSFARTFYSERISEIIAKLSQKYNFYLVIT